MYRRTERKKERKEERGEVAEKINNDPHWSGRDPKRLLFHISPDQDFFITYVFPHRW